MANTAAGIVESLGGPSNIASLSHCATRLRFQLRDSSAVAQSAVEAVPGVLGAVPQSGNRYQAGIAAHISHFAAGYFPGQPGWVFQCPR